MGDLLVAAGLFVAAFLLGSIPFGLIISKVFYHTDLREHGSGNIGTTNAIRTMGKVGGYAVFVLDFGDAKLPEKLMRRLETYNLAHERRIRELWVFDSEGFHRINLKE